MVNSKLEIDIVYLWVDSSDSNWQKKRQRSFEYFLKKNRDDIALYANTDGRFRDNDELLYNLRCLEKFFPKHGHVYIVTDNQKPSWLLESNKITIIDHNEIIPERINPIFASAHIESYIHYIPNLSENFFYLNDDIFFGMPVDENWWFDKKLKYFYANEPHNEYRKLQSMLLSPINSSIQSKLWLKQKYKSYIHRNIPLAHAPRPYKKSLLFKIEEQAIALYKKIREKNFRTWRTPGVIGDLVPRWLEYNKYAEIIHSDFLYIESGSDKIETELELLTQKFGKLPFFCINDTCDDADALDERLQSVREVMETLLPNKSSFEI
ncbi:Stealth CR1 domain-containing protein [Methylophilaceae bacterium]|nr:Stealth CR1 domain-containing protein [Methylophilaceae bacterium]